jgi:hypothetical protein
MNNIAYDLFFTPLQHIQRAMAPAAMLFADAVIRTGELYTVKRSPP